MPSRHSHLITDAPLGIGAVRQVYIDRGGPEARLMLWGRTQAKNKFPIKPFPLTVQGPPRGEEDIRLEERGQERARIAHELHDTLLQGFLGAIMLLHQAVEQTPADSPSKPALSHALQLVRHAVDEGRAAILGLRTSPAMSGLEQAFATFLEAVTPARGVRVRVFVQGKPRTLNPAIQEQVFLIGREAVMNALRHSDAKSIEVEIQYLRDILRMFVRDNGCGITPDAIQQARDSHWGLRGMRDRAANIDARFGIWSRPGAGTELRVAVPLGQNENP